MLMCVQKSKIWIKFERKGRKRSTRLLISRASERRLKSLVKMVKKEKANRESKHLISLERTVVV